MPRASRARTYSDANTNQSRSYWDYESIVVNYGHQKHYQLVRKLGRGKYGEVFECLRKDHKCVVKVLRPLQSSKRYKREIKILENLEGGPNIIRLLNIVKDPSEPTPSLVFEYVDNANYKTRHQFFSDMEVRFYMFQLLKALDYSHSKGIIHRDVKPQNVMIDTKKQRLRLIDWGQADFYHPGRVNNVTVGSRFFKAPELLLEYEMYNYSVDLWSFGAMFAGMIFQMEPFFAGKDNDDQLVQITAVLGTRLMNEYVEKYGIAIYERHPVYDQYHPRKRWETFLTKKNVHLVPQEAISFLEKLLIFDHIDRITAAEAMNLPYFAPIVENPSAVMPEKKSFSTSTLQTIPTIDDL